MDKLENETWEEYAFRHELFEIKYADKDQQIIDDVRIPNPDKSYGKYEYYRPTFCSIIWEEIQEIKKKYNMDGWDCNEMRFSNNAEKRLSKEDNERQKILYALKRIWESKEKDIIKSNTMKRYYRYIELTEIISKTHKEEIEELFSISPRMYNHLSLPENTKEFQEYKDKREEKIKKEKKERIELYEKYLKNKEIRLQIIELQQKINQLTCELV